MLHFIHWEITTGVEVTTRRVNIDPSLYFFFYLIDKNIMKIFTSFLNLRYSCDIRCLIYRHFNFYSYRLPWKPVNNDSQSWPFHVLLASWESDVWKSLWKRVYTWLQNDLKNFFAEEVRNTSCRYIYLRGNESSQKPKWQYMVQVSYLTDKNIIKMLCFSWVSRCDCDVRCLTYCHFNHNGLLHKLVNNDSQPHLKNVLSQFHQKKRYSNRFANSVRSIFRKMACTYLLTKVTAL